MIKSEPFSGIRGLRNKKITSDFAVIGGGLAGLCAAITAAREGLRVTLVQDRPVLGGNASSEVRLWALGATSHQGNNNRWSREGGVINEIMEENAWRNKEGNPVLFDVLLLEKVRAEKNITLLLNTAMINASKVDANTIQSVRAYSSQDFTLYDIEAPLFCDASGDGILGYLAGAAYRVGAEGAEEFGEPFAPEKDFGELLGHTIYFYAKDTGKPVEYVAPEFALKADEIPKVIPRFEEITAKSHGTSLWWLEYGGRLDTIHDTEAIKWELWKVTYGVWDYLKNSGKFPEMANKTLEWVGAIPGKRESRRFEGDYMISQSDVIGQKRHPDAVAFGGWAVDLHPADGVYSEHAGCVQFHSKGVYQIPYRCMYSRNIRNLFTAGRVISASHIAFGSTRVMMTTAHSAQAVGMAAAICHENHTLPRDLLEDASMQALQTRLLRTGQYLPFVEIEDDADLARQARVEVSSERKLDRLAPSEHTAPMNAARALLMPADTGAVPKITFWFNVARDTEIVFQLRSSERLGNYTPDTILAEKQYALSAGSSVPVTVDFDRELDQAQYLFACVMPCEGVEMILSDELISAVMSVAHIADPKVAKNAVQHPPEGSGFDSFEFWIPERRPDGRLPAVEINPPVGAFAKAQLQTNYTRPLICSNTWIAGSEDATPAVTLSWDAAQTMRKVVLHFDVDWDHAMESVQFGHFDRAMPFCVKSYCLTDAAGALLAEAEDNHHGRVEIVLDRAIQTDGLTLEIRGTHGSPAAVNAIKVYG
jgi:hypothetical protein